MRWLWGYAAVRLCGCADTGDAMATLDNGAVLRAAVEAWNLGDLDTYLELYDPDVMR
jgi:hypothetical protein